MRKNDNEVDYGLKFFAEVLKVEHLHWGYFPEKKFLGNEISFTEMKEAQLEYTKHLFTFIPSGVHTILDVGAGLGKTAALLCENGYQVHCLANDKYQQSVINKKYPEIPYTKTKFEDNKLNRKFDMVLMSESVQYIDWPRALERLDEVLNPGNYLLLADYFRKVDDSYYKTCKIKEPFMALTNAKFNLLKEEDITDNVLPTLDFANHCWNNYVLPSADIIGEMIENKISPLLRFVLKPIVGKMIEQIRYYIYEHSPDKFNPEKFKAQMYYLIQLWQKK